MPQRSTTDFTLDVRWNVMDINKPPFCSGIYAVVNRDKNLWFYIGKANNIAKRIICKNHPIQVTKNTTLKLRYMYLRADKEDIGWLERFLIRTYSPQWNGGTTFEPSEMGYTPWVHCNIHSTQSKVSQTDLLRAVNLFP